MRIKLSSLLLIVWSFVDVGRVAGQERSAVFTVPRPLLVVAHRDLSFGTIVRGIASSVSAHSGEAGLFEIQGEPYASIRVDFILPTAMTSDEGDLLQLLFGPGDGTTILGLARTVAIGFDPREPLITTLGPIGKLQIRLGGTVLPMQQQQGGTYRATVSLTVFDLGS